MNEEDPKPLGNFEEVATGVSGRTRHPVVIPFERYEVTVILDSENRFIGIRSIAVKKSFLSQEQRMRGIGYYDDSKFYTDSEVE